MRRRRSVGTAVTVGAALLAALFAAPARAEETTPAGGAEASQAGSVAEASAPASVEEAGPTRRVEATGTAASIEPLQWATESIFRLPFQLTLNIDTRAARGTRTTLIAQPVIKVRVSQDWNLITRTTVPVLHQPPTLAGSHGATGLGDTAVQLFLSPTKPGRITWGAGATVLLPTGTEGPLGTGKWAIGPTAAAFMIEGRWVFGFFANNVWSFAGQSDRPPVNLLTFQPFTYYNLPNGWYLTSSPIATANWEAPKGQQWTVPVGGGVGRVFRIGGQPVNVQIQGFQNVERPKHVARWQLRFQFQWLFPK
jgi:hypothetical protein